MSRLLERQARGQCSKAYVRYSSAVEQKKRKKLKARRQLQVTGLVHGLTALEVAVEHGLAADVVAVGDLLAETELVAELRGVDGTDQRLAQVQLVDAEVDFEQLVHQIEHAPALRVLLRRTTAHRNHQ